PTNALGQCSFIIDGSSREYHWQGVGCLSIKSFAGGEALYDVGRGRFRVAPHSYLLLNQSQPYAITVEAEKEMASFCLFFEDGLAEEVQHSLNAPAAKLLDDPARPSLAPLHFFEKTYPHDDTLSPALFHLRDNLPTHGDDEVWIN